MMECKKALTEADGDMAKAEEVLRVKLGNKASKAATRIAAEGIVGGRYLGRRQARFDGRVNCETDFVAKNDDFLALVKGCAQLVSAKNLAMWLPCRRCRWAKARSNRPVPHWSARSAKTCRCAALCASKPSGRATGFLHPRRRQDRRAAGSGRW